MSKVNLQNFEKDELIKDKDFNNPKKKHLKVDINNLMDKVREEKKKEKKENLIFLGIIASAVLVTGAIASF